jgi:hypothetical protein
MTSRSNHLPILANNSLVFLSYEHMLLISLFLFAVKERQCTWLLFFFFGNSGCLDQLTRTTINPRIHWTPCKPSRQVRHHGDDRRARWGSNPGDRGKETLPLPLGHKPRCSAHGFLLLLQAATVHGYIDIVNRFGMNVKKIKLTFPFHLV